MRFHHQIAAAALLACAALAGCGDDDDGGGGAADAAPDAAAMAPDAALCDVRWRRVAAMGTASAMVESGNLVLRATGAGTIGVRQTGVTANFDATFSFEGFVAGGSGAFVQAVLSNEDPVPDKIFTAGIGTLPVVGISAAITAGTTDVKPTTAVSGSFRFQKTGNSITVTTTGGGVTAMSQAFYGVTPLAIGLQIGTSGAPVGSETSIRITDFAVTPVGTTGGTRPKSDDFSCSSVL